MTEPGFVAPTPTGWWARKDKIGVNENETDIVTTTVGKPATIERRPTMKPANRFVGPMALRQRKTHKWLGQEPPPVYHAPGDEDGTTTIPHKVPKYL